MSHKDTTPAQLIQPGDKFTAFDLYHMSDVLPNHLLHTCIQYCIFVQWNAEGTMVRLHDVIANSQFWAEPDGVIVIVKGWVVPEPVNSGNMAVA